MSPKEKYLHGYTKKEQKRLYEQARFAENIVYSDIDLSSASELLEVGSGVGAQTEILLRRFPSLHLTGIDYNANQVAQARAAVLGRPQRVEDVLDGEGCKVHNPPLRPGGVSSRDAVEDARKFLGQRSAFKGANELLIRRPGDPAGGVVCEQRAQRVGELVD